MRQVGATDAEKKHQQQLAEPKATVFVKHCGVIYCKHLALQVFPCKGRAPKHQAHMDGRSISMTGEPFYAIRDT